VHALGARTVLERLVTPVPAAGRGARFVEADADDPFSACERLAPVVVFERAR